VRTVDHNLQTLQVRLIWKRALAKLDVASGSVVEPSNFAEELCLDAVPPLLELGLDKFLNGV